MSNHQHTLIIDGTSGISGDMTVAALLDLGASEEHLREQLATLPVDGFSIAVTRVNKHGIDACDFDVQLAEELENHDHDMAWLYGNEAAVEREHEHMHMHEHEHEHEHEHHHHDHVEHDHVEHDHVEHDHVEHDYCHEHDHGEHGHGHEGHHHAHHHHHRSLADVTAIIDGSQLSDGAKRRALAIFTALAAAEAKAHGKTPETVMFHEVGAVDSIVDVCSVAICLDDLGIEDIVVESLSEGHGTIRCAHGLMPIPVPAVANLCQAGNIALTPAPVAGELVTPTGAAIVTALRTSEHLPARYCIEAVGYGAGKRPYEGCSGTLRCLLVHADA
ncbi:LarC family nickel insertion protein [Collinsella sp. AM40-7AC]|uniref:LarC family nickel insertion protein n=1 Tax=Collinsella TaxID=102106 RepID=UPI000E4A3FCC|nr:MULTISPECIES: LarC family nickel insertion protein [Collinsella]RHB19827.1 LarC family nickel insertion protein [Collinsella sp. AM40-7AC]